MYNPKEIDAKWQKKWEEDGIYKTPTDVHPDNKMYILPQLPYPSGSGLHMGHVAVYMPCDVFARYQRMQGKDVLQVLGWDSFGLPAENYAIKTNVHPKESTEKAINNFRHQIKSLGISVDWDREVGSHNPDYYKWTQWFFLLMYKQGLAYRKKQPINWCDNDKTVLANAQVEDGKCERCGTVVVQKDMDQWYLKITEYADRLIDDLDKVDWPAETIKRQRDWIGRSEGIEIDFEVVGSEQTITVFTTTPVNYGATFLVVAPEHPIISEITTKEQEQEVTQYIEIAKNKTDLDRQVDQKEKTGVFTGAYVKNHLTGEQIPVWVADFVLYSFGTGAVQGCPAHDERDFDFAKKFDIPIIRVVASKDGNTEKIVDPEVEHVDQVKIGKGIKRPMVNSGQFDGLPFDEGMAQTIEYFESQGWGRKKINYKLRDWSISRQRFWGAPVPMLYDNDGKVHPIPEEDLPVMLPDDVDFKPTGESPLNYSESFHADTEARYGDGWKRDVDTLDTFMCSSWYYYRYIDPKNDGAFASPEALKNWMPVDFYIGGPEHVNGHLLYSRFFTKVLFDAGFIDFDEPFAVHRHQGLILGPDNRKMSKRWGNVVNPNDVVEEYGADTARIYQLFMGPLEDTKPWNDGGVKGVRRFLDKVWKLQEFVQDDVVDALEPTLHKLIKKVGEDTQTLQFNTAVAKMMEFVNAASKEEAIGKAQLETFLTLLAPYGPHIAEEMWEALGHKESVTQSPWPSYDEAKLVDSEVTIVVQVNGKVRAKLVVAADTEEDAVKTAALAEENVQKWLEGKEPKKVIYVPGKLVSVVV